MDVGNEELMNDLNVERKMYTFLSTFRSYVQNMFVSGMDILKILSATIELLTNWDGPG